jgi:DNA repair exonuclease SbcCD nuclease subunit
VVTGDNHLGRHYDRMPPQRLEERRARLRRGFVAAVDYALQQRAHFLLHAGDLFDTVDPRNVERDFVAAQLVRVRDAGIVCLAIASPSTGIPAPLKPGPRGRQAVSTTRASAY